jgi:hypothetical protein
MCGCCCLIFLIAGLVRAPRETQAKVGGGEDTRAEPQEDIVCTRRNISGIEGKHSTSLVYVWAHVAHLNSHAHLIYVIGRFFRSYFFAPIISVSLLVVQRETKGLQSHGVYKETKSTYQAASGGCVCVSV